jgi:NAD(P)H-flavin reductase
MIRLACRELLRHGLAPEQLWVSLERNMKCAFGVCGHCQLGPLLVCRDGPVFPYTEVARWLEVREL